MDKKKAEILTLGAGTLSAAVAGAAEYLSEEMPLIEETIMTVGAVLALGAGVSKMFFKKNKAMAFHNMKGDIEKEVNAEEVNVS